MAIQFFFQAKGNFHTEFYLSSPIMTPTNSKLIVQEISGLTHLSDTDVYNLYVRVWVNKLQI
jgi:hypothetical protein